MLKIYLKERKIYDFSMDKLGQAKPTICLEKIIMIQRNSIATSDKLENPQDTRGLVIRLGKQLFKKIDKI